MTRRDKLAGWVHLAEFIFASIGLFGWAWWITHPERQYHLSKPLDAQDAAIRKKVGL